MKENQIKLFIHIGQPKTGTSAIQGFLNYNREILSRIHKILYPNFDNNEFDKGLMHNHAIFFSEANRIKDFYGSIHRFNECIHYCRKSNISKIVISNEGWSWQFWPGLLKRMIDTTGVDYNIIVYLRRQDKFLESAWKQWGHKIPDCGNIQAYIKKIELDWYKILKMWTEYFDQDKFIIRTYEKSQIGDDIVKDFASIIGIEKLAGFNTPPDTTLNTNAGFNWEVVELMKLSRGLLTDQNDNKLHSFMNRMLSESYKKRPMEEYSFLSPREKLDIIRQYEQSNNLIAKEFLNQKEGNLFNDPLPDPDQKWIPHPEFKIENLIPIMMEIMINQQDQIQELKVKLHNIFGKK